MLDKDTLDQLCNPIFALDSTIRFAGIINKMGKLVAGGMKQGLESMENNEKSLELYMKFVLKNEMNKDFDPEFGRTVYSFSEREKIKLASFPLDDNYLLRVSIDKDGAHNKIIERILELLKKNGLK
ncbi:MAG: DUF6659 family protein [Nitrososphaeraceae archaeon]|jgi:Family of unknown function (DUF6659)